jgi:hypothetical protein
MSASMEDKYNYKAYSRDRNTTSEQLLFTNIATTKDQLCQSLKVTKTEHLVVLPQKIGLQMILGFVTIKHF